jgi:hypothetical protein
MFALALLGCNVWFDETPTCAYDVYEWSDDVTAHILTGDGSGSFSYDPDDDPRVEIRGSYDPSSGDFSWTESFGKDFYLDEVEVEGFGTAYHNGDVDVIFERAQTDMLDAVTREWRRVRRQGCDMAVASWADGAEDEAVTASGSYPDDDNFQWTIDYAGYDWRGSLRRSQARTEVIDADDGSYFVSTIWQADGVTSSELEVDCYDAYFCVGTTERGFFGVERGDIDVLDGDDLLATITWELDYEGEGSQTIAYADGETVSCSYDVSDGACTYECDDGSGGDC